MEDIWDKFGAIIAAVISALGGWYIYDRTTTNNRISRVETDIIQNKIDIRVIETKFAELKEDTSEIKSSLKDIIELLPKRRK